MTTLSVPAEERVVLPHVRWDTYERLLADHEDARSPRFTYDRGVLEIMSPGSRHESLAQLVTAMMFAIAETRDVDVTALGSTTFKDAALGSRIRAGRLLLPAERCDGPRSGSSRPAGRPAARGGVRG